MHTIELIVVLLAVSAVGLRDQGVIGDDVPRRVQRDLDLETMLLESAEDDAPRSPYELE
jgi:hypothetical protein